MKSAARCPLGGEPFVARGERQVRPKFLRVFAGKDERIDRINAGGDDAQEHFVLLRLRHRRVFIMQRFDPAVLVDDDRFHRLRKGGSGHLA